MRRALLTTLGLLLVLAGAAPVAALAPATTIDEVVSALRDDPVYNDPKAEMRLTDAQADQLRAQIRDGSQPIHIAILPAAAKGSRSTQDVGDYLRDKVGEPGDYAVVVGKDFVGSPASAANQAFRSKQSEGLFAVLTQYVTNVNNGVSSSGTEAADSGPVNWWAAAAMFLLCFGLPVGIIVLVVLLLVRSSRRKREAQVAVVRATLEEDITAFGESLDSVDSAAITSDEDRTDWMAALDQYDRAKKASEAMKAPIDAKNVTAALDEGRYRVACVQARLTGQPLPERRAPCFFDPRHGLSVEDVPYAPTGGAVREVPACAACVTRIADGENPDVRMVNTAAGPTPYWNAGPEYRGWASGYYGGPDIFSTVLLGTMLGNAMSHDSHGGGDYGGGDFGGGNDSDWGGGSFGGGDFGGGDFGGGGGGGDFGSW